MPNPLPLLRPLLRLLRGRWSSPLWLAVRLYLGWVWLGFGLGKVRGGWLALNPMEPLLEAVAAGHTPAPLGGLFRPVARLLLDAGAAPLLSVAIPVAEAALGLAFLAGVVVPLAAIAGILVNLNLVLAGIASLSFDGRIVLLQLLLLAAGPAASWLGLGTAAAALRRRLAQRALPPITSRQARAT